MLGTTGEKLRIEDPTIDVRIHAAALAVAAAIYLAFELWFNLRLLEIAGGEATLDELHAIETIGRTLSGCGLALAVLKTKWAAWLLPGLDPRSRAHRNIRIASVIGVFAASIGVMTGLQRAIVDGIAEGYDATERQRAASLVAVTRATAEGKILLSGIDGMNRAEALTYRALLPYLQDGVKADEAVRQNEIAIRLEIERALGVDTAEGKRRLYDGFAAAARDLAASYREYRNGGDRLPAAEIEIRNRAYARYAAASNAFYAREDLLLPRQNEEWASYRRSLAERNVSFPVVDPRICRRVRDETLKKLPRLPLDWNCNDRSVFAAAIAATFDDEREAQWRRQMREAGIQGVPPGLQREAFFAHESVRPVIAAENARAETQVRDGIRKAAGVDVPPGLSYAAFANHPTVFAEIGRRDPKGVELLRKAGFSGFPVDIVTPEAFERRILRPVLENAAKEPGILEARARAGLAPAETYGIGGANAQAGRRAVEAMVGPPIALFFSLLFFVLNLRPLVAGVLEGAFRLVDLRPFPGLVGVLATIPILAALAYPMWTTNAVVENANFQARLANKEDVPRTAITWLAHAQPLLYGFFRGDGKLTLARTWTPEDLGHRSR